MRPAPEWDHIIVGGGTAGCVLARRLTDRGRRVLLVEAGGPYPRPALGVPLSGMRQTVAFSWKYFTAQQRTLAGRRLSLPLGRVLGGSSSVNAMMYVRGGARCFDRWRDAGNPGWSFREVLPYFLRSEDYELGASSFHGAGGPLSVSGPRHLAPFSEAFVEACVEAGVPVCEDFNAPDPDGAGFFQVTQRRGERASTALAYLRPARRNSGLHIATRALVTRLLIEGGRAIGIEYRAPDGTEQARCSGEIILACGAANSPKILMLSGIGPAAGLRALGISPLVDLPGVGCNLQDHVRIPVLYESGRPSPGRMGNWLPAALQYAVARRGVLASNCCESGALVRSDPDLPEPDLQFVTHFQSALYPETVDLQFCLVGTESRGNLRLRSADPAEPPQIDPAYISTDRELKALLSGLRLARRLAATSTLSRFPLGREIMPGADIQADAGLISYFRGAAETCYHLAGTCAMGRGPDAVVDAELRVHGVENLRIADASIMPELVPGNTLAATVMIAEKAAGLLLEGLHPSHCDNG